MGIVALAFLAAEVPPAGGDDDVNLETHQFGCEVRQPIEFPICIAKLNDDVFTFDIAELAQTAGGTPRCGRGRVEGRGGTAAEFLSAGIFVRLLRLGG